MTVIIDYGAGNIKSVEKALLSLGQEVVITDDADTILNAERIILPGVGAFGNAMAQLEKTGLDEVIREAVRRKIPFLGICLGLQLLFENRTYGRSHSTSGRTGRCKSFRVDKSNIWSCAVNRSRIRSRICGVQAARGYLLPL